MLIHKDAIDYYTEALGDLRASIECEYAEAESNFNRFHNCHPVSTDVVNKLKGLLGDVIYHSTNSVNHLYGSSNLISSLQNSIVMHGGSETYYSMYPRTVAGVSNLMSASKHASSVVESVVSHLDSHDEGGQKFFAKRNMQTASHVRLLEAIDLVSDALMDVELVSHALASKVLEYDENIGLNLSVLDEDCSYRENVKSWL